MQSTPDPATVLVVDDEKGIRDGSERIISRMGCNALTAKNDEEGLGLLGRTDVAIVLLDLKMPGIDGMEVLKRIQAMDRDLLVIVITGFATIETAIEAMKRGAYDFVPKPFEPDQLRIVVNRAREKKIQLQKDTVKLEAERRRTLADLGTEKSRIHTIVDSQRDRGDQYGRPGGADESGLLPTIGSRCGHGCWRTDFGLHPRRGFVPVDRRNIPRVACGF